MFVTLKETLSDAQLSNSFPCAFTTNTGLHFYHVPFWGHRISVPFCRPCTLTASQNGLGWNVLLEVIWSSNPSQSGPPREGLNKKVENQARENHVTVSLLKIITVLSPSTSSWRVSCLDIYSWEPNKPGLGYLQGWGTTTSLGSLSDPYHPMSKMFPPNI